MARSLKGEENSLEFYRLGVTTWPSRIITKGGLVMGKQIQWEASLTTTKAKAKKEKKLILIDFYNNL